MKVINFGKSNRSENVLHIETDLGIINIRVNLHDSEGNEVEAITINPDEGVVYDGGRFIRKR